jgi:hypothetical protein
VAELELLLDDSFALFKRLGVDARSISAKNPLGVARRWFSLFVAPAAHLVAA